MNEHFIIRVANGLFVEKAWISIGGAQLTDKREHARTYANRAETLDIENWLENYGIDFNIVKVKVVEEQDANSSRPKS